MDLVVVTPELKLLNEAYYTNPATAPTYVFTRSTGLRTADSNAFAVVLHNYTPIDVFKEWQVLARDPVFKAVHRQALQTIKSSLEAWIPLPTQVPELWCELEVSSHLLGQLLRLFYYPVNLTLTLHYGGSQQPRYSVPPQAGRSGFVLSSTSPVFQVLQHPGWKETRAPVWLRVTGAPLRYHSSVTVRLYRQWGE